MGNTVYSATPIESRVVEYTVPGGGSVRLNYTNMTYSIGYETMGRQQVKRIFRLSFRCLIAGDTVTDFTQRLNNAERTLSTRGGTLTVHDGGIIKFKAQPANVPPTVLVNIGSQTTADRTNMLYDIDWGPHPLSFTVEGPIYPTATSAVWVVEVHTVCEDAVAFKDALILGVDAEISYMIDQNHYTTRRVNGRIAIMNFGRSSYTLQRSALSQADIEALRLALLAGAPGGNIFMDPIRIPPQFIRLSENFSVDSTENFLYFTIIDQERYRMFPAYMTDVQASLTTTLAGISTIEWYNHVLVGHVEAPRDVNKIVCVAAFYQIVQTFMGFLFLTTDNETAGFVLSWSVTNDLYNNRIGFRVEATSPMSSGGYDVIPKLGIANFTSDVFFPQGTGGSAGLHGSGYRTEVGGLTRDLNIPIGDVIEPPGSGDSPLTDLKGAQAAADKYVYFDLQAHALVDDQAHEADPNSANGLSDVYQTSPAKMRFVITLRLARIFNRAAGLKLSQKIGDIAKELGNVASQGTGFRVARTKIIERGVRRGAWGQNDMMREEANFFCEIFGVKKQAVISKGGLLKFINWLNSNLSYSSIENIDTQLAQYFNL